MHWVLVIAGVDRPAEFTVGAPSSKIPNGLDAKTAYRGVAASVREHLIEAFNRTQDHWRCERLGLCPLATARALV